LIERGRNSPHKHLKRKKSKSRGKKSIQGSKHIAKGLKAISGGNTNLRDYILAQQAIHKEKKLAFLQGNTRMSVKGAKHQTSGSNNSVQSKSSKNSNVRSIFTNSAVSKGLELGMEAADLAYQQSLRKNEALKKVQNLN
jgi:hypothetical protein